MGIETAVFQLLTAQPDISGLCASRIYPNTAPQGAAIPYCTYQIISNTEDLVHEGAGGLKTTRFQINAVAGRYADTITLDDGLKTLHGTTTSAGGCNINLISYEDSDDRHDTDLDYHYRSVDLIFYYTEV